eukprot:scaffold115271_cov30-Phaeocystis_antarctica.AAC.1
MKVSRVQTVKIHLDSMIYQHSGERGADVDPRDAPCSMLCARDEPMKPRSRARGRGARGEDRGRGTR